MTVLVHRHGTRRHSHEFRPGHRHLLMPQPATLDPDDQGDGRVEDHDHDHDHSNDHSHEDDHGHSHGLIHDSIKRSRAGVRAVLIALAVLGIGAIAQTVIFILSGSVALLADLIHNFGDALTAIPLGAAFLLRSERAEKIAGLFVVAAIFISACVAGVEAVSRIAHPSPPTHLLILAAAGAVGFAANAVAAMVRSRAGRRLDSPALIADGDHARADAFVSLGVIASAIVVALGAPIADPLIGLAITLAILRITWSSWQTISGSGHEHGHDGHAHGRDGHDHHH
ncbi:MAG: cation diffusion facilitator family transporter [Acidobacteriota bacterium]|nr:cation diffusion facilitator family transporter [Acidobacteriota bacterium]